MESLPSGVYIVQNAHNHNWAVISNTNDYSEVISGTDTGNNIGNKWHLKRLRNETYTLKNDLSDYYATYSITDDFDHPVMSIRTSNPQQWRIEVCNSFYIIFELDGLRCWTLGDEFLGTPIELKDYNRSNRQHWAILPPRSVIHVHPRPANLECAPSLSVDDAPIDPLAMPFIQTAQNVDLSNATVSHVAGNMYNINVYSESHVLNPAFDDRTSEIQENTERLHDATGSRFEQIARSDTKERVPSQRVNNAPIDLLADNFTGRLKDLDFLSQVFSAQNVATGEIVTTRCAVHGMPGVGKTNLVLRFAQIVFAQLLYSHIFWMSAATPEKLIEGMTKILDLVGHPERLRPEQNAKVTAARLWLEDFQPTEGDGWLLILDNVDQSALEFLREHLPRWNAKGKILFTTRSADVADVLVRVSGRHSALELRVPDLIDTTDLLFTSAGIDALTVTPEQQNQAEQLVSNFGSLPLAVVHAASHMRQTDMTLDSMLQMSKGVCKIEMIKWESSLATHHQRSVMATFDAVLDQLARDFPRAYDILRILSFLDPEDIPLVMLANGAQMLSSLPDKPLPGNSQDESRMIAKFSKWSHSRRPSQHHSQNSSDHASPAHLSSDLRALVSLLLSSTVFPDALHQLQSLSLVERLSRGGEPSLRVHDLVHLITQEHVKRHGAYQAWLKSAVSLVCGALRRVEDPKLPKCWPECGNLMPHVRFLSKLWTGVYGMNLELVMADVRLAQYLNSRGRYDNAGRLCERSVGSFREKLGEKHKDTLSAFYLLAHIYYNQGRTPQAEEAFKHVLAVRKKELGADHEDTLMTMNNLALVYHKQDRCKEAEGLFERVLAVQETTLGPDHTSTLTTMHNLALVYGSQKQYDKAGELFEDVLTRKEKNLGPDHVNTLTAVINLAFVYRSQTKYVDAEELLKRALDGREKQLGDSHPHTLTAVLHLAHLYQLQARNDEAEPLFLRALTGMKQHLGANHRKTVDCAKAFDVFYRSQGRNSEADALLEDR